VKGEYKEPTAESQREVEERCTTSMGGKTYMAAAFYIAGVWGSAAWQGKGQTPSP